MAVFEYTKFMTLEQYVRKTSLLEELVYIPLNFKSKNKFKSKKDIVVHFRDYHKLMSIERFSNAKSMSFPQ